MFSDLMNDSIKSAINEINKCTYIVAVKSPEFKVDDVLYTNEYYLNSDENTDTMYHITCQLSNRTMFIPTHNTMIIERDLSDSIKAHGTDARVTLIS